MNLASTCFDLMSEFSWKYSTASCDNISIKRFNRLQNNAGLVC